MASLETDREKGIVNGEEEEISPVEEVRLTVPNGDDPTLPVWTFRVWFLGILSCLLLSFVNTFFGYRTEPLTVTMISIQVASLPLGRFMAKVLPDATFRLPGFGSREFSLNPGPFNMKEHVLISIFANAGSGFGGGSAYAISIVDIVKAFYKRKISFLASWLLVITTQVLGYGWAGIMRKYVIEPAEMWWPSSLVQVSLFRALHEKDSRKNSRARFFLIALVCSFSWYLIPGYLFPLLSSLSILCLAFPKSVTAHQIGSGLRGLGIFTFTFDWSVVASYLGSPLVTPFFAIFNVFVGYIAVAYVLIPICYWGLDLYNAKTFPLFSSHLFDNGGQRYDVSQIVNDKFELDLAAYERKGRLNMSIFFALGYGLNFAAVMATIIHVALFNGREIYERYRASYKGKPDIHTRLMKKYNDIPSWWFHSLLVLSLVVSLALCIFMQNQVQLPWWGLLFAAGLALIFTLPISIITATTNQTPGLNVITEYVFGMIYPGRPIANVCFKTYGYISMSQAVSFLNDFKLGHYMKVPPRAMFYAQLVGTIIAGTVNIGVAWYLLTSIENICQDQLLPSGSPWTCPGDTVFFNASVIWGLIGPKRIFGSLGRYRALNWCFLGGAVAPIIVWLLHKAFPKQKWIKLINIPVLLGATAAMPPATTINYNSWVLVGTVFNLIVFRYRKGWWQRYNYVLSAALDAGLAFMGVALYFCLGIENVGVSWWGSVGDDHCGLASCPTAKGVAVDGCPVF
ncbi:Sexual differentiation process protein ISP4 [Handroanthus impetiginosus]|uniref:Sexual differentiation process protein ISP4 n=1 Tax=Handroanthus impetiginosus TaxID=429701 RepID=A0A2G9GCY8_9LAMI|nr:Sexual differentiation process protein ISP4 [Handroanthus impetiginosus]